MPERRRDDESYPSYWDAVGRERVTEQLRATCFFVLILQAVFIGLDRWAYPEHFGLFFPMRTAVNLLVLAILFRGRFRWPAASQLAIPAAVAAEVLAMIYATGGPHSHYYTGLILVFVGMPVLQPIRAGEAAALSGLFCAGFAATPLFAAEPVVWEQFGISLIFVCSGAFESVVSCSLLTGARLRDFAQRREIERARDQLEQLDREKSRFTANVHHELRTPLTLTLAPLEGMLAGEFGALGAEQRSYLETMHSNALRLLKLINNLLDLAKIEGRQLRIARRELEIGALVRELLAGARPLAERKGLSLEWVGEGELPLVCVDPDAIEKVVVNLLGNALKFSSEGGRVEVRGEPGPDAGVHLTVSDDGVGIPPSQLERVFDRFAQVDASSTRRHEGTGIGLALARELVELHGGRIWAESEGSGRGTTMHVTLPRGAPDALAEEVLEGEGGSGLAERAGAGDRAPGAPDALRYAELAHSAERAGFDATPVEGPGASGGAPEDAPELLVVEDNADMRRLLRALLAKEFRVRLARNGREALEALRARPPELVLTDVMMPEMTGTELCRAIKQDPETRGIPVVLVTSRAEREMKIEGLELGADDYVAKPFHPRELVARVRSLVRLRRLQEELAERNAALERSNGELARTLAELREAEVQIVQAERLAAVGELAAGVAHEVNNPVNFAANALRTLQSTVEDVREVAAQLTAVDLGDPERALVRLASLRKLREERNLDDLAETLTELVAIATEGIERTSRLVGDLRELAAPARGPRAEVDVARGLRATLQLVRHALVEKDIELEVDVAEALPAVAGDAGALNQVFLNLLKNAAEALEGRGGTVWVRARSEGAGILVEVQDDGPGIAPELQARLFEPFFSTKAAGRGTGLGLAISRRIAAEHGGSIACDSRPGGGTTFRVRLPAAGAGEAGAT